jgi:hypothetical protein
LPAAGLAKLLAFPSSGNPLVAAPTKELGEKGLFLLQISETCIIACFLFKCQK